MTDVADIFIGVKSLEVWGKVFERNAYSSDVVCEKNMHEKKHRLFWVI